ncbi:hypothetical protein [Absidia glauca]|uniref:Peroxisomal membrane protein PEX16 n=1 Tax=Absidia glauca TaxID=4829 RepID=A0A168S9D8_ABSGL|nr:hypothetical protein [Absidia glauca]
MLVTRKSKPLRWRYISWLESIKVLLRLVLYVDSRKAMVLHPTHFIRNIDTNTLAYDTTGEEKIELAHLDTRTGVPSSANIELLFKKSTPDMGMTLQRTKWAHLAELLWIFRPLLYVILLRREHYKHRRDPECTGVETQTEKDQENYWLPWVVSIAADVLAMVLRYTQNMSPLEKEESKRRNYLLLFYFLRGPMYSLFTSRLLDIVCSSTEHRPLVSILTTAINDCRPFWEQCYSYTSGS